MSVERSPHPATVGLPDRPPVVLVHWQGGAIPEWNRLLDAAALPRLARLARDGVVLSIDTSGSSCATAASVTLATGFDPDAHGVVTEKEARPDMLGVGPPGRASRSRAAIWEIAHRHSRRSAVVGWPASHPARPDDAAVVITDRFARHNSRRPDFWPLDSGTVQPESLREDLLELRIAAPQLSAGHLSALVPGLDRIDQERDDVLIRLAGHVARCATDHAAAVFLSPDPPEDGAPSHRSLDLLAVHYSVAEQCSRLRDDVRDRHAKTPAASCLEDLPANALGFLDLMLGRLMHLWGPRSHFLVVATPPCGTAPLETRAHSKDAGVLIAFGPHIRHHRAGAVTCESAPQPTRLVDIAPTVLALLGIAPAADLDGRVLDEILGVDPPPAESRPWTFDHAESGNAPRALAESELARLRAIERDLRARGYAPPRVPNDVGSELVALQRERSVMLEHASAARKGLSSRNLVRRAMRTRPAP